MTMMMLNIIFKNQLFVIAVAVSRSLDILKELKRLNNYEALFSLIDVVKQHIDRSKLSKVSAQSDYSFYLRSFLQWLFRSFCVSLFTFLVLDHFSFEHSFHIFISVLFILPLLSFVIFFSFSSSILFYRFVHSSLPPSPLNLYSFFDQ